MEEFKVYWLSQEQLVTGNIKIQVFKMQLQKKPHLKREKLLDKLKMMKALQKDHIETLKNLKSIMLHHFLT